MSLAFRGEEVRWRRKKAGFFNEYMYVAGQR